MRIIDRIRDWLKETYEKVKNRVDWRALKLFEKQQTAITDIRNAYFEGLEGLREKSDVALKGQGTPRYSEKSFADQVDEVLAGTFPRGNALYLGKTADILTEVGLNGELPMLTTAQHIRKANMPKNDAKHQHGLGRSQLQSLPQKIAAPVMILDSLNPASNSIVVVTDMVDKDASPVIAKGRYNDVEVDTNFVTSYYGKDGFARFLQKNVDANAILFVDKKKAAKLSAESSTQWLEQLKDYSSNVIIRKTHAKINFPQEKSVSAKGIGEKRYSMIGKKGKANDRANALTEPIDTGLHWFVGNDGKLRLEISDASARINTEAFVKAKEASQKLRRGDHNISLADLDLTVKDVFQHDVLFQLYPELPDMKLAVTKLEDGTLGSYSPRGIMLSDTLTPKTAKPTLLHEIQHYIQDVEGFADGGSLKNARKYALLSAAAYADPQEFAKLKTVEERKQYLESVAEKESGKDLKELSFIVYRWLHGEMEAENAEKRAELSQKDLERVPKKHLARNCI